MTDDKPVTNVFHQTNYLPQGDIEENYKIIAKELGMSDDQIEDALEELRERNSEIQMTRSDVPLDAINPAHYRDGKIEVWDFIVDKKLDYCLGAVVKYVARAGKKGGPEKELEDLKKARNYLDRKIHEVEERDV